LKKVQDNWQKILILIASAAITLAIHYGWILQPIFGHASWVHAIHGRLCYIPIVIAASWFGLSGGVWMAAVISVLALPYIFYFGGVHVDLSSELIEIIFYYAIALLAGGLIDREAKIRYQHEQSQLQLERSHKLSMIGQMAAGVAHEIKNPLASIKGAFEILTTDSPVTDEKREFQDIVFKEIKRIDGTVMEFLEFARPKEFKLNRVNLGDILESVLRQFQNQIEKAGLKLKSNIAENIYINADPEKIHQVIINFILNSIEASTRGGNLAIALIKEGGDAKMIFEDNGAGISADEAERIFEPFYTTKPKGTGLGLAIVKSIIERHGGSISVSGGQHKGAIFTITLPVNEEK